MAGTKYDISAAAVRACLLGTVTAGVLIAGLSSSAAQPAQEVQFSWRDVTSGRAALAEKPEGNTTDWKASVAPLTASAPKLIVETADIKNPKNPAESVTFRFRLDPAAPQFSPGADARYLFVITGARDGVQFAKHVPLRIHPVFRLAPQTAQTKYALTASRDVPFTNWRIEQSLLLRCPLPADVVTQARHELLGVVHAAGAGAGMDTSAVIRWGANSAARPAEIPLDIELSRWSSAKMSGQLTLPDGQTRDVVVQTSDRVIYPLLVILAGVGIAFAVKRYLTQGRPLLLLQATLAEIERRLVLADESVRQKAGAGFQILPAWRQFHIDKEAELEAIRLRGGALDQPNTDFTAVRDKINAARTLPESWTTFGDQMAALARVRGGIAALQPPLVQGGGALLPRPALEQELTNATQPVVLASIADVPALAARVVKATDTARTWRDEWDRSVQLARLLIGRPELANTEEAQRRLWQGFDAATMTKVDQLLDAAAEAVVKSGAPAPAPVARRESAPVQTPATVSSGASPANRIERDDRVTFAVALGLAVLVGLNAEYFGKPFGSLADYARILAWALTASVGVDLASAALNRGASVFGGVATRVTRS
jgi:hypothetical protein